MSESIEDMRYEEALAALERIQQEIENNEVPMDALAEQVRRANALVRHCRERLRQTEEQIRQAMEE